MAMIDDDPATVRPNLHDIHVNAASTTNTNISFWMIFFFFFSSLLLLLSSRNE